MLEFHVEKVIVPNSKGRVPVNTVAASVHDLQEEY